MPDSLVSSPSLQAKPSRLPSHVVPLILVALAIALVVAGPHILGLYMVNLLTRAFFVAMVAVTVSVLWGTTGYLTFGQSAFFGIGAYGLAIVFSQYDFGPAQALLGFAGTLAVAGIVALFVGWISFFPGSTPLYATVISLVLPIVFVQLLYSGGELTGSSSGLVGFFSFDLELADWFRIGGLALVGLVALAQLALASDAGKVLLALRDNETRCAYLGLNTPKIRIALLVLSALVAAAAGFGYAGFGGIAAPENASFAFGTQLVVAVALGGRGFPAAGAIGAILIEVASAYLSGSLPFVWELLVGISFILTVLLLPEGLFGSLGRFFARPPATPALEKLARPAQAASPGLEQRTLVDVADVSKRFGSLQVLSGVTFSARAGELLSLVGPNGAGKSTLMKCLADGRERSGGRIAISGRDIARRPPDRIVDLGLGRKFQMASVFESLTVAQCLRIARANADRPALLSSSRTLVLPAAALRIVEMSGLAERLDTVAKDLSHGLKQALELAMVLSLDPQVVLLDEPTAGLTRDERRQIGSILVDLCSNEGLCILLVEHDLDFVKEISSRIIVLHQGKIAMDGAASDVMSSSLIAEIYAGAHAPAAAEGHP